MPTIQSMELPLPKNWQDFETIVRDAMAQRWRSSSLSKNGRPGQKQKGVDIYGRDELGRPVAIQCKRFSGQLRFSTVEYEVKNAASEFVGRLTTLFIATTADHDSKLQEQVRSLSETRTAKGEFAVGLLFWDEIVAGLVLNPAVLASHYPQLSIAGGSAVNRERHVAALELGYFGAEIWEHIELVHGEFGWMAQEDPDQVPSTLRIVERRAHQLLSPADAEPIVEASNELRQRLNDASSDSDWQHIKMFATRISKRIIASSSLLALDESNALDLGVTLARIYHQDGDVTHQSKASVRQHVLGVLGPSSSNAVDETFSAVSDVKESYRWPIRIYNFVQRQLRYA